MADSVPGKQVVYGSVQIQIEIRGNVHGFTRRWKV